MGTIKDAALNPVKGAGVKNISELQSVDVMSAILFEANSPYPYNYIEDNGTRYRIPKSVINSIGVILQDNPNIKRFKVKKTGTTKDDTSYTVIPLA
jgi:hypothetical protein